MLVLGAPGGIVGNVSAVVADHRSRRVIASAGAFGYALSLFAFGTGQTFAALACASFTTGFFAHTLINGTELALIDVAGDRVSAYLARAMLFGTGGGLSHPRCSSRPRRSASAGAARSSSWPRCSRPTA